MQLGSRDVGIQRIRLEATLREHGRPGNRVASHGQNPPPGSEPHIRKISLKSAETTTSLS
jgi:hypothetical protein